MHGAGAKMRLMGGGAFGKEILIQHATQAQCQCQGRWILEIRGVIRGRKSFGRYPYQLLVMVSSRFNKIFVR